MGHGMGGVWARREQETISMTILKMVGPRLAMAFASFTPVEWPMEQIDKQPDCPITRWSVHRQDDNGNCFVVETGLSREEAERLVATYEARGHKQMYWAEAERG
jgi:hypothetical protein